MTYDTLDQVHVTVKGWQKICDSAKNECEKNGKLLQGVVYRGKQVQMSLRWEEFVLEISPQYEPRQNTQPGGSVADGVADQVKHVSEFCQI